MIKDMEPCTAQPDDTDAVSLAIRLLAPRLGRLSQADRDDFLTLVSHLQTEDDPEERESILRALAEILAQKPVETVSMLLPPPLPMSQGLQTWATDVGRRIKELRTKQGLNQTELAERAGLNQSHISRLENAEHSPTHLTLEKIAKALGVDVGEIDPSS